MVTTDISQLAAECTAWKTNLRNLREDLAQLKTRLQDAVSVNLTKNSLPEIERYDNQVQIQLLNIHDLKQAVKENERTASWELSLDKGISESIWAKHEALYQQYQHLTHTIQILKDQFNSFTTGTS